MFDLSVIQRINRNRTLEVIEPEIRELEHELAYSMDSALFREKLARLNRLRAVWDEVNGIEPRKEIAA